MVRTDQDQVYKQYETHDDQRAQIHIIKHTYTKCPSSDYNHWEPQKSQDKAIKSNITQFVCKLPHSPYIFI